MTSDNTENINATLRNTRDTFVIYMFGEVRDIIEKWFVNRKEAVLQIGVLTKWVQNRIEKRNIKIENASGSHKQL